MLKRIIHRAFHPAQLLVASFVVAILTGTSLFMLPVMVNGESLGFVDALFTATSAVCVTGLIVVDTATKFTPLGQAVILLLVQIGGLGIMTFSVIFVLIAGKKISFKERLMIQDSFTHSPTKDVRAIVLSVIKLTLIVELAGALLLFARWSGDFPLMEALFISVFHSVSAFCNAGFSLFSSSLMDYRGDVMINLTVTTLILTGGIGFLVIMDLRHFFFQGEGERKRLSLHSKLVLLTSAVLVVVGTVLFYLLERDNALAGLSLGEGVLVSYFHSITARTAGFNTVDFAILTPEALFFIIILMFIGASPGSTGGGVKTSTFGVLIALSKSRYLGRDEVSLFKRTIPKDVVARAISIVIISVVVVIVFVMILLVAEKGGLGYLERRTHFLDIFFEAVSAFGTVGLSTGLTPGLTDTGKLVVSLLMFIGRLGPLTIALAVGRRMAEGKFSYSEERVMTG